MLSTVLAVGLGATTASALAVRSGCDVQFTVSGAISGAVGQISSGQVRAGSIDSATFDMEGSGFYDSKGRGCFFTPPTNTFQCDEGQTPASGFEIACDGSVSYNGQTTFYECKTSTDGQYNIYLTESGTDCNTITLMANGCHAACEESSCPDNLDGTYEYPHLIIPVDSSKPNTAAGTSYDGTVTSSISSIFNFDIPSADSGKKCSLVFLFPEQKDLETSSFTISGDGVVDFAMLDEAATQSTTYDNKPGVKKDYGTMTVAPGNSYSIATFDCPSGEAIAFEISAKGDIDLTYFQDYNPSPIGLYITVC